jgi:hypothetical protein
MAEEIIFRVGVDTTNAQKGIEAVDAELKDLKKTTDSAGSGIEKRFSDIQKKVASGELTQRQLTKAVREYQTIALQAGETSPIGQQAIAEAGALQDRIGDLSARMRVAGEDGQNMQAALQLGSTVMAGYGAFQGITALVGKENEELTETLVKLNAVQTILISLEEIRGALEAESALRIKATTIAQKLYTLAVGETTGAMKLLRLAMIATGIGALIAGIILLVQNWDALTGSIGRSKIAQEGLNDTLDDYKTGATDAVKETNQVKVAFDLAKQGVISKEEALQTYNDTLGDSFGKASDLNEAERLYAEKTDAYIKATALRAQANALLTKAAEEQANALTAQMDDQVSQIDKTTSAIYAQFGFINQSQKTLNEGQKQGVADAKKTSQERASIFEQEATRLLKEAETTETANGIKSESEQKLAEQRQKIADDAAKKRQEAAQKAREEEQKRAEELIRLEREITDATIAAIADRETRERMALEEKHRRELEDLRKQYGERQELIMALEERQAIEQQNFNRTQDELSQQIIEDAKAKKAADDAAQVESTKNLQQTLIDIIKKSAEDQLAIDEAIFQSRASFASNVANVIGQLAGLAKEGTATQKALALTEIAINTAVGFVQGLRIAQPSAAASGPAAAFVFPIFYAQQLAAVLGAAKQAKNILGSGASVSAPSVPSSGGSGFSGGVQQTGSLTENGTTNTQTLQQPNQVMVVLPVDSLKKVQSQSMIAESVATFG